MAWDPRYPPAAQLPCGLAGMVNHENRLLSEPTELLTAAGVAMDDLYLRKEPGAAAYDTAGLNISPGYTATLSDSRDWLAALLTYTGTAPAFVRTVGTDSDSQASVTSITLTVTVATAAVPVGRFLVVAAHSVDDFPTTITISDSRGNTYTTDVETTTGGIGRLKVVSTKVATQLEIGDTITVAFTGLTSNPVQTSVVATVDEFSGIANQPALHLSEVASGTGTAVSVTDAGTLTLPELLVGVAVVDREPGAVTVTPGGSFSKRGEVETTTGDNDIKLTVASRVDLVSPTIIAVTDWYSDAETTPAGTVTTEAGSTTVTGSGTTFTSHAPGDRIVVNNETRIISSIASATSLTTTTAFVTANAGATYKVRVGNRIITATTGGNLFKEKPSTLTTGDLDAVTLKSGLSQSARPGRFVAGGKEAAAQARKLFYFNGVDPPQVLAGDGTSTAAVTPPTGTDWSASADENSQPINGLIHENRLLAWGNLSDPHRVYATGPDDHDDFSTADAITLRFRSDVGDRIWCGASFQGVLFVFKYPRGIFYLDDTDLDIDNWSVRTKSEALGCAPSPYAVLQLDDDVLFMAADGTFHLLSAVDALGGTRASDLTRRLGLNKWIRDNVNVSRLGQAVSAWHQAKKLAMFTVPSAGSTENDLTLKFDFSGIERNLPLKFSYSTRDTGDGLAIRRSPQGGAEVPILGEGANVYVLDQDDRNKDGDAYTAQYQTPHLDFSHLDPALRWKRKLFEHLELLMEPVAAGTLTVEVYVDGSLKQTLSFDATKRRQKKKLNVGDGYTISLRVTNATVDEDFKVLSHMVWFKVGNEDKER